MARLSPRRSFILLICVCFSLYVCLLQRDLLWVQTSQMEPLTEMSPDPIEIDNNEVYVPAQVVAVTTQKTEVSVSGHKELPWFMTGGTLRPKASSVRPKLWPEEAPGSDRITDQLMFVPPNSSTPPRLKKILFYNGLGSWPYRSGREAFKQCPVNSCVLTSNKAEISDADAVLFKDRFIKPAFPRSQKQVWILYFLECPYHTQQIKVEDVFNWTATYREDSDIVAPYERWQYYDDKVHMKLKPGINYALNKTKKVAWFVSNCGARNTRLEYAKELQNYIEVDIYGACGSKNCPRSSSKKCHDMLDKDYKFYLAFENSNCKHYITEKFFVNGLMRNVLPIVMGARPEDYAKRAPEHSYIHVDDFSSPKELAAYLHQLDADDDLYNSYFLWKGTGEFINTHFFCRLCALLHDDFPVKVYHDINNWWSGPGTCTRGSWQKSSVD